MHRFARLSIAAAAAACAVGASTQAVAVPVPAGAQVVGGPGPSGERLVAWMRKNLLCTALQRAGQSTSVDADERCRPVPAVLPLGHDTLRGGWPDGFDDVSGDVVVYGVAGSEVAVARLATSERTLDEAPTVEGRGALHGLRFFFVAVRHGAPNPSELHLLDGSGTVRRAEEIRPAPIVAGILTPNRPRRLHVSLFSATRLAPTPLEPTRHDVAMCAELNGPDVTSSVCDEGTTESDPLVMSRTSGCSLSRLTLLVRPGIDRLSVVLADGRRRDARLLRIPGAGGRWLAGYVRVPGAFGIRRLEAWSDGAVVAQMPLRLAPPSVTCDSWGGAGGRDLDPPTSFVRSPITRPGEDRSTGAPVAADRGAELCIGLGAADACALPPVEPKDVTLTARGGARHEVVLGVVPVEIARVSLVLADRRRLDVTPTALPAEYTGRYGTVSRLVAATLPRGQRALAYELHDAVGRLVGFGEGPDVPPPANGARVLPAGPSPPLYAAEIDFTLGMLPWRFGCLAVGAPTDASCFSVNPRMFVVEAQCTPRRIVVYGVTPHTTDRLVLQTADGREVHGRTAALPQRLARVFELARGAAAIATMPPGTALRRLVLHDGQRHSMSLRLPPASEQCGYVYEDGFWVGDD